MDMGTGCMHVLMHLHGPGSFIKIAYLCVDLHIFLRYIFCMLVSVIVGGVQVRSFVEIIWNNHLRVV